MFGNGNKVMMGIEEKKEGNIYISNFKANIKYVIKEVME